MSFRESAIIAQYAFEHWSLLHQKLKKNAHEFVEQRYSWIGHGLQSGPTLAFSLWLSDIKTKTSFGFLIKNYRGHFFNFSKKLKKYVSSFGRKNDVFSNFS